MDRQTISDQLALTAVDYLYATQMLNKSPEQARKHATDKLKERMKAIKIGEAPEK